MKTRISKVHTDKGDYIEISIFPEEDRDGMFYITFRRYPVNVFVGTEDYRDDLGSGQDIEDCIIVPVYVIEKTPCVLFNPYQSFLRALRYLGEINSKDDVVRFKDEYQKLEKDIRRWQEL